MKKRKFKKPPRLSGNKKAPADLERGPYRCKNHPDRYPAVEGKCWECLLGKAAFKKKFSSLAEYFYQPDGPGYAGDSASPGK